MLSYLELKLAQELHGKAPEALTAEERSAVQASARRQQEIEHRVLASPLAAQVNVPPGAARARLEEVRARYDDAADFDAALTRLTLSVDEFERLLERELRVEAVLERVAADVPPVSEVEAEIFYHQHRAAFRKPEVRRLRHILIAADAGAEAEQARALLAALRPQVMASVAAFAALAERHSQCPTALQGGELGPVRAGQLHAEIEPAAFALAAGEVSQPLRSPVGWHLLRCDAIEPAEEADFRAALPRIRDHLDERRRARAQKAWIKALFAGGGQMS